MQRVSYVLTRPALLATVGSMSTTRPIDRILTIMAALRAPETGCPWDLQQDFESIAPYTLEEAYEVVDAIERGDMADLQDELGDLLLQVVFHAQMAEEAGLFTFDDVAAGISDKMTRRHPHVFADQTDTTAEAVAQSWDDIKAAEKEASESLLDDVPIPLPALSRAVKLQKRAARIGFDWTEPAPIFDKLDEELRELRDAMQHGDPDAIEDEYGDVLFVIANLARHLDIDPEKALRRGNAKFTRRFQSVERQARAENDNLSAFSLDALEVFWQRAKAEEKDIK